LQNGEAAEGILGMPGLTFAPLVNSIVGGACPRCSATAVIIRLHLLTHHELGFLLESTEDFQEVTNG
jgi:hypothetical protein